MAVHLSDHFTYKKLFKAVYPSILMMVFTSIYTIIDGLFISNFVGKSSFAAINLIWPVIMVISALGFMFGTGGSALVSKILGEGDKEKANKVFSMIVYSSIILGVIVSAVVFIFIERLARLLGATDNMIGDCVLYGRILIGAEVFYILQNVFQSFFVTAEKPILGFLIIVLAGVTNIILDAIFIVGLKLGVVGAALATIISYIVGSVIPIVYFSRKNNSLLKFVKTKFNLKAIGSACLNGLSELLTNISASVVSMLFNLQLLKFAGENGVAAYGVIMYASFIFAAVFFGYSIGISSIIGYHYGADNKDELKNLLRKSLILIGITGLVMTGLTEILADPLSQIFVRYDAELLKLTTKAMRIYSLSFLIFGFNSFMSSFFTALNNGIISALISFMRIVVFQAVAVMVIPIWFGLDGVWSSIVVAEFFSVIVAFICLVANKKKYQY